MRTPNRQGICTTTLRVNPGAGGVAAEFISRSRCGLLPPCRTEIIELTDLWSRTLPLRNHGIFIALELQPTIRRAAAPDSMPWHPGCRDHLPACPCTQEMRLAPGSHNNIRHRKSGLCLFHLFRRKSGERHVATGPWYFCTLDQGLKPNDLVLHDNLRQRIRRRARRFSGQEKRRDDRRHSKLIHHAPGRR